jgi:hypothetical protein
VQASDGIIDQLTHVKQALTNHIAGSVLDWMESVDLSSLNDAAELAQQVEDSGDTYFVPSFSGKLPKPRSCPRLILGTQVIKYRSGTLEHVA